MKKRSPSLRHLMIFLLVGISLCLVGCQSATNFFASLSSSGVILTPVATIGCGKPAPVPVGTSSNETITSNHISREYRLHIPEGYTATRPQALILNFHGHAEYDDFQEAYSGLSKLADLDDFIVVYPQGTIGPSGKPGWTSSGAQTPAVDYDPSAQDVLFVSDVLSQLQAQLCIDSHRIYATGYSNGGGMANLLACDMAKRIAAIAPVSGAYPPITEGCHPARPVPVLEFHGTADTFVSYQGVPDMLWPPIPQWLQSWATLDGCMHGPITFFQRAQVTGEQWTNCQQNSAVVHYRIEGAGHTWPGGSFDRRGFGAMTSTISANQIMWQFFQAHPLP